jgi:3-deoxy-D-arabino-heptulosonate 7-phosphate (DAHP) synthase
MSQLNNVHRPILVAGPCAAETPEQIHIALEEAKARNVDFVRISLWKPRTKPGFDGMKQEGIALMVEAARMGLNPATEILVASQAEDVMAGVLPHLPEGSKLMLWIGARNQNHIVQQEIARAASRDPRVCLMVKNQPWPSESHWEGIAEHALEGGIAPENLYMCHRGFTPDSANNPRNLRNVADSDMAMRVREKTRLPMLLDLSHIAGAVDKLEEIAMETVSHNYDGMVIEVHHNPRFAWTDAKQQITWDQLDALLANVNAARQPQAEKAVVLA